MAFGSSDDEQNIFEAGQRARFEKHDRNYSRTRPSDSEIAKFARNEFDLAMNELDDDDLNMIIEAIYQIEDDANEKARQAEEKKKRQVAEEKRRLAEEKAAAEKRRLAEEKAAAETAAKAKILAEKKAKMRSRLGAGLQPSSENSQHSTQPLSPPPTEANRKEIGRKNIGKLLLLPAGFSF